MSEERIIYAVSDGSYSDYGVIAIFEDEQKAEAFREWHRYDCVEEFPLNPELPAMRPGWNLYQFSMDRSGDTEHMQLLHEPASTEHKTEIDYHPTHYYIESHLWCVVVARDEQHAVKITNEKRAQLIAMNKWPADSGNSV